MSGKCSGNVPECPDPIRAEADHPRREPHRGKRDPSRAERAPLVVKDLIIMSVQRKGQSRKGWIKVHTEMN